jgi:GMP synthase (glutamine-hydrolysing)
MMLVVDCGSTKVPLFEAFLSEGNIPFETQKINQLEFSDKYEGAIISGAPILITEDDTLMHQQKLVPLFESNIPVLAVCFGHQMLGFFHGAKGKMGTEDRDFNHLKILAEDPLFNGFNSPVVFHEDHCEEIELPTGFLHLATSKNCFNEAMKHPTKKHYGIQFHPETSEANGQRLMDNFLSLI